MSAWVFKVVSSLQFLQLIFCVLFSSPNIQATCPAHVTILGFITLISGEVELNSVLTRIKNHKAPGEDGLNGDIFKYAGKLFTT